MDQSGQKWRKMESNRKNTQRQQPQYLLTVCTAEEINPPQDPIRPARYLNGVKWDDYEMVSIA